jgi:hypothetical protein
VWGEDAPVCDGALVEPAACCELAVVGRAGYGEYSSFEGVCRPASSIGGPLPPGSGSRDRVEIASARRRGTVVDLAGNLSEWMLDWSNRQDEGVWEAQGLLRDPLADVPGSDASRRSIRGGSWRGNFVELRAAAKAGRRLVDENRAIGLRCARRP